MNYLWFEIYIIGFKTIHCELFLVYLVKYFNFNFMLHGYYDVYYIF